MRTGTLSLLLIGNIFYTSGELQTLRDPLTEFHDKLPTLTWPLIEFHDKGLVELDYSQAFNIQDFSKVVATYVMEHVGEEKLIVRGAALQGSFTEADVTRSELQGKKLQTLEENTPIIAMMDPCVVQSFFVRVVSPPLFNLKYPPMT